MKFGLTPGEYQFIVDNVVKPLQSFGAKVWCYGSRARGDFKEYSDLDLMVESQSDVSEQLGAIRETLENSNFPYKVDLVALDTFAQSYLGGFHRDKRPFKD